MQKELLYNNIKKRWSDSEASINGVLGGFDNLNDADIKDSLQLLEELKNAGILRTSTVLDCCAGIGRVSDQVLQKYFDKIDLFDQEKKYIDYCREFFNGNERIDEMSLCSLQDFEFSKKYDVIWSQWGFENLDDDDLVKFLLKCKNNLGEGGLLIAKENICRDETPFEQGGDYKIRSQKTLHEFFDLCGFDYVKKDFIKDWPNDFFRVATFVLKVF